MDEEKRIGFEIRTIGNLLRRYFEKTRPRDLDCMTGVHGWAIRFFYENREREIFQRDFEERFSIRRSTATQMLKLMEKNGLIVRVGVDYDARLKKIELTDKAAEIYKMIEQHIDEVEERLSAGITKEELDCFYRVTEKLKANLEDDYV